MQRISNSSQIDTHYSVETPEGIELLIIPAGLCSRALAFAIDFAIRAIFLIVVLMLISWAGEVGTGIFLIIYFVTEWLYPVFFEVFKQGATPGKRAIGLQVLNDDGTPISFSTSMLRNLLRVVDFMPVGYFAGIFAMVFTRQYKRLGDMAAGTIVAYREELRNEQENLSKHSQPFVVPREIQSLNFSQQQAIIEFGERSDSLSQDRQHELAGILIPLLNRPKEEVSSILRQSADKLLGR